MDNTEVPRVYIVPMGIRARTGTHDKRYGIILHEPEGEWIGESRSPFYEAARLLKARGYTGRYEMWGQMADGSLGCRMFGDIEKCSELTAEEGPYGPRLASWRPSRAAREAG